MMTSEQFVFWVAGLLSSNINPDDAICMIRSALQKIPNPHVYDEKVYVCKF